MSDDVYIEINWRPFESNITSLTPWDTLVALSWWQWLLVLKGAFVVWVLTVTIVLPSIYMHVGRQRLLIVENDKAMLGF